MTLIWLDHDNLLLNTIPRLIADPTKSILFTSFLNPGITDEILVLESKIYLDFEGLIHSPFAGTQLSILSKSQLINGK